tara:strand:+ start:340 stop:528 length:189 start_codon:yes stop_codon:yes gene_type:complete
MKKGNFVKITFPGSVGIATIASDEGFGFYKILFKGELRMMHEDYIEVVDDERCSQGISHENS